MNRKESGAPESRDGRTENFPGLSPCSFVLAPLPVSPSFFVSDDVDDDVGAIARHCEMQRAIPSLFSILMSRGTVGDQPERDKIVSRSPIPMKGTFAGHRRARRQDSSGHGRISAAVQVKLVSGTRSWQRRNNCCNWSIRISIRFNSTAWPRIIASAHKIVSFLLPSLIFNFHNFITRERFRGGITSASKVHIVGTIKVSPHVYLSTSKLQFTQRV